MEKNKIFVNRIYNTLNKYSSHLSDSDKIDFEDDIFHACDKYIEALLEETFKCAFANALLLAFESKQVSEKTLEEFMKVIKK